MRLALQWEDAVRRRVTEAQARRVLSDIHEQIHGNPLLSQSTAEYGTQWLGRKGLETAAATFKSYKHTVEAFVAFLGNAANQPMQYVTPTQVSAWRDAGAKRTSALTVNNRLKILRVFFQSAWRDGLIQDNPAAKVGTLKTESAARRPFTLKELKAMLRVASPEWRGMILAGLYTGQRLSDLGSLTWLNVDLKRRELSLVTNKTGRRQIIPIAKPLRAYLENLPTSDDPKAPIFPEIYPLAMRQGGSSTLSQQFHDVLVAANLVKERPPKRQSQGIGRDGPRQRSEISYHSLRHSATSLLKNAGVPEAVARDLIGHESAEISRHYTHVDERSKRSAIAKLPDLTTA